MPNFIGTSGSNTWNATAGTDIFNANVGVLGGSVLGGIDTVSYLNATSAVNVNLLTNIGTGVWAAGDSYTAISNLTGSNFSDTLTGNNGVNILNGRRGKDTINAQGGDDTVFGGGDSDAINGGDGNDLLYGDDNNLLSADTPGDDTINGGNGDDRIYGENGNDNLFGDAGSDRLWGGNGNDILTGGAGGDILNGEANTDTVNYGTAGSGVFINLALTTAQASIYINTLNATVSNGDAAGDIITNVENLTGSNFADILWGNSGANVINGGGGNDIIRGGAGADTINGGTGSDTADYSTATSGVFVNLALTTAQAISYVNTSGTSVSNGDAAGDVITNVENLTGSNFSDILQGNTGINVINGGGGNDIIRGGGGSDIIDGGTGSDTLDISQEAFIGIVQTATPFWLAGGNSQSVSLAYFSQFTTYTNIQTGVSGNVADAQNFGQYVGGLTNGVVITDQDTILNIENISGSNFGDIIVGNTGNNILVGMDGNDYIIGGIGFDIIKGGNGDDFITNLGSISVEQSALDLGGELYGDAGNDNIVGYFAQLISGGDGNDYIFSNGGVNLSQNYTIRPDFNGTVYGGDGNDNIYAMYGDITVYADNGNDILWIDENNADIYLGAGNDIINAFDGQRNIFGEDGNDVIKAVAGFNDMWGGNGNDTFYFGLSGSYMNNNPCYVDFHNMNSTTTIHDFELGVDIIQVFINTQYNDLGYSVSDYLGGTHIQVYNSSLNYNLDVYVENVSVAEINSTNSLFIF